MSSRACSLGVLGDSTCQISQRSPSAVDTLLAGVKVCVAPVAADARQDCVRVQLFRKLVTLLGGQQSCAGKCDVCVLVSPEAQNKEQSRARSSKQNGVIRVQRQKGACKNRVDVRKLGLASDAVLVADSWLKSTIEKRKKQPFSEHRL